MTKALAAVGLMVIALSGCKSNETVSTVVTNPFTTADKVPPPPTRTVAPGVAQPYYPPANTAGAPPASAYSAAPAFTPGTASPAYPAAPAAPAYSPGPTAAPVYPNAAPAQPAASPYSQPYSQPYNSPTQPLGSNSSAGDSQYAANSGDAVAVPGDAGSLRYATPQEMAAARMAATGQPGGAAWASAPATANGWIAGSAPVRGASTQTASLPPGVATPGGYAVEPVRVAQLNNQSGSVAITPLEPAPQGGQAGEPAPLRVASPPPSSSGWY